MKDKLSLFQISHKLKSIRDVPTWMCHGLSAFSQIRLIRNALGMTQAQLAKRAGCRQSDIAKIEGKGAQDVQVSTLLKMANALGCELFISFVPKETILENVEKKSLEQAKKMVAASSSNMAMELQKPDAKITQEQILEMKENILRKHRSILWDESES